MNNYRLYARTNAKKGWRCVGKVKMLSSAVAKANAVDAPEVCIRHGAEVIVIKPVAEEQPAE